MLASEPYLIGETAYNHQGDFDYLLNMVKSLPEEVDAVKFHLLLNPDSYIRLDHPLYNSIKNWVFSPEQWDKIFTVSLEKNLDVVALCDDPESLEFILARWPKIKAVEVHSSGLSDCHLLRLGSRFEGVLILGIGGSSEGEIERAIEIVREFGKKDIFLMYGFQSYPTQHKDVGFYRMLYLKDKFGLPMGYADHCPWDDKYGLIISALPCGFGVPVIEKHFTLDKGVERIDWQSAVSPQDLSALKQMMDTFWQTYDLGRVDMNPSEVAYGKWGPNKKVPCYRRNIEAGDLVELDDIVFLRIPEEMKMSDVNEVLALFSSFPKRINRKVKSKEPVKVEDFM